MRRPLDDRIQDRTDFDLIAARVLREEVDTQLPYYSLASGSYFFKKLENPQPGPSGTALIGPSLQDALLEVEVEYSGASELEVVLGVLG